MRIFRKFCNIQKSSSRYHSVPLKSLPGVPRLVVVLQIATAEEPAPTYIADELFLILEVPLAMHLQVLAGREALRAVVAAENFLLVVPVHVQFHRGVTLDLLPADLTGSALLVVLGVHEHRMPAMKRLAANLTNEILQRLPILPLQPRRWVLLVLVLLNGQRTRCLKATHVALESTLHVVQIDVVEILQVVGRHFAAERTHEVLK